MDAAVPIPISPHGMVHMLNATNSHELRQINPSQTLMKIQYYMYIPSVGNVNFVPLSYS